MKGFIIFFVVATAYVSANCGCLKCSQHLKVASPPSCPIKVIYKYPQVLPECFREHQYQVQMPLPSLPSLPKPTKNYNYRVEPLCLNQNQAVEDCCANQQHEYQVQMPLPSLPSLPAAPLNGLKFRADRIVLPAPRTVCCWGPKNPEAAAEVASIVTPQNWQSAISEVLPISQCVKRQPTCSYNLEPLCVRYEQKSRRKRQVDFVKHGTKFLVNMLPDFFKDPLKQTLRSMGHVNLDNSQKSLKEKIEERRKKNVEELKKKLYKKRKENSEEYFGYEYSALSNEDYLYNVLKNKINKPRRIKRDIIIGGKKLDHPFYRVKEETASSEEIYLESKEIEPDFIVGKNIIKKAVQEEMEQIVSKSKNNNFLGIIPQNPLFLMLKAPLIFLKHFNDLNKGINPLFANLPKLVYGTKKYFRDFGRNFKKNCLNLCSDIIGDFEHNTGGNNNFLHHMLHPRFRRSSCKKVCEEEIKRRTKRDISFGKNKGKNHLNYEDLKSLKAFGKIPIFIKTVNISPENNVINLNEDTFERKLQQFEPQYSLAFNQNKNNCRKKRYIVQVCNEDDVHDYLSEKLVDEDYLEPLTNYYNQLNSFLTQLFTFGHNPVVQNSEPTPRKKKYYSSDSSHERRKKKLKFEKLKPRVIIDNNGLPFLEMDGMKRPLFPKKNNILHSRQDLYDSSEETGDRIVGLIQHAKEKELVGASQSAYIPVQTIRDRISSLLSEIDDLLHIDFEEFDHIFEDLIKIQHIKNSIVQDWKRVLIKDRLDDVNAKIGMLDKFRDLQHFKDVVVEEIAKTLKKNDSKFLRKKFINCLIRLHKLQCIISNVVDDFEEHLKMHTHFNTKKEIEYVDLLSELNFANSRTRNDILRSFSKERDEAMQENMELVNNLKKMLVDCDETCENVQKESRILWEMKNIEKLQKQTIKDMNRKLELNYKIKKELKILIDLQKRYDRCLSDQDDIFNDIEKESSDESTEKSKRNNKKDPKQLIEEIKKKYDEFLQKSRKKRLQMSKNKK